MHKEQEDAMQDDVPESRRMLDAGATEEEGIDISYLSESMRRSLEDQSLPIEPMYVALLTPQTRLDSTHSTSLHRPLSLSLSLSLALSLPLSFSLLP